MRRILFISIRTSIIIGAFILAFPSTTFALSIDKSNYNPGEAVSVTCLHSSTTFQLYDITSGIDGEPAYGGNLGQYNCGSPASLSFDGVTGHTYAILELFSGTTCSGQNRDGCSLIAWSEVNFTVGEGAAAGQFGTVSPSFGANKQTYTVGEVVYFTCYYARSVFTLYDITSGIDGEPAYGGNIGQYNCGSPASLSFDGVTGHTYALVETSGNTSCSNATYASCISYSSAKEWVSFGVGSGYVPPAQLTPGTNKSSYTPAETVYFVCISLQNIFSFYNITSGIDGEPAYGGNLGQYNCGSPASLSFDGIDRHTYAILELTSSDSCANENYASCKGKSSFRGETNFKVENERGVGHSIISYRPEVHIISPKGQAIFSSEALINYLAIDKNDKGGVQERTTLGLRTKPVSIYISDKIAEWDHSLVSAEDKQLVAKELSAEGSYSWNIKNLIPGFLYRIIVDAIDVVGDVGEDVSDFFSVDFNAPVFRVRADPPVTRKEDVTIIIDVSKELSKPPIVTVTQKGGKPIEVIMKGEHAYYEGLYSITEGYDGIATITVTGRDRAGNIGTKIVSGGSFAVGVDIPPKPHVSYPHNSDVVATDTITVSGSTRDDTTIVLKVNGTDIYTATSSPDGTFLIKNVRLSKEINYGVNMLSIAAEDLAGLMSEEVPIQIKFNIVPTAVLVRPTQDSTVSGTGVLEVKEKDENGDLLLFTYQVIPAQNFDSTQYATSTKNEWITIADSIPTNRFSWDTTEVEDGSYFFRVIADDGTVKAFAQPVRAQIRNTLPYFRFEDGRKTITASTTAVVIGRAITSPNLSPRPNVSKVEYSTDNGKKWTAVKSISGIGTTEARFSVIFSGLSEGVLGVLWRVRDSGNLLGRASHPILVDATVPSAPVIFYPRTGTVISDEDDQSASKKGLQIAIYGSAEPSSTLTLTFASTTRTAKVGPDGKFLFSDIDVNNRGANTFTLSAKDTAGNISSTVKTDFIYDNPPQVIILTPKPFRGLKGKATVTWSITDIDKDPIQNIVLSYRRDGGAWKALPIDPTRTSFDWDVTGFSEGRNYELKLEATDGVVRDEKVVGFSIDTIAPSISSFTIPKHIIGKSETLTAQGSASDTLSGVEFVEYSLSDPQFVSDKNQEWFTGLITKGFLQKNASFSIKYPTRLEDGTYKFFVRAVDSAGNISPSISKDIIVDTVSPRIGSFAVIKDGVRIPPDSEGGIGVYLGSPVTFSVSLEGDALIASLFLDKQSFPLTKNIISGLWETDITVSTTTPLFITVEDNVHNIASLKKITLLTGIERGVTKVALPDGTEKPLSGVDIKVLVLREGGDFVPFTTSLSHGKGEVVTDEAGSYDLALPQGTYTLVAHSRGFLTQAHKIALETPTLLNVSFTTKKISPFRAFFQAIIDYFRYSL